VEPLTLHQFHESSGATFAEIGEFEVVTDYGDPIAEHRALHESAGIIDLSFRSRICLTGADRLRFLHGQVTNDVKRLSPGSGCYAALITAKGRMESDLNIYCLQDDLLLDFEPGLSQRVSARLEKYVIADDVQIVDVAPHYGLMSVQGPSSKEIVESLALTPDIPAAPFSFTKTRDDSGGDIYLINQPRFGTIGFDIFAPLSALPTVAGKLRAAAKSGGAVLCGWLALEMARIESGTPRFGVDMDETNLPLEAGIEARAISFNKGCYIGQEVISRIKTYSEVSKALRGLQLRDKSKPLPKKGDKLFYEEKEAGYITNAISSPWLGNKIALGYVRKEMNQIGTVLTVQIGAERIAAEIVELPFKKS
jgi:folate-binding protein YgfZ